MLNQKPSVLLAGTDPQAPLSAVPHYTLHDLAVTVTCLPTAGIVVKSDGFTQVVVGDTLTAAELAALRFLPISPPSGEISPGNGLVMYVPQSCSRLPIPLLADLPADVLVEITELPSNGLVFLADGMSAVTRGQAITAEQLSGLTFRPVADAIGQISLLRYRSSDQVFTGEVLLVVGPDAPSGSVRDSDLTAGTTSVAPLAVALLLEAGLSSLNSTPASAAIDPKELSPPDGPATAGVLAGMVPKIIDQAVVAVSDQIPRDHIAVPATALLAQSATTESATTSSSGTDNQPSDKPRRHHIGSSTPPDSGSTTLGPLGTTLSTLSMPTIPSVPSTPTSPPSSSTTLQNDVLLVGPTTSGATHWANSSGGQWNVASNWSNGVPGPSSNVVLDAGGTYVVTSTANVDINSLVVDPGVTLLSNPGTLFTVEGGVVDNGTIEAGPFGGGQSSTVDIKGNVTGSGVVDIGNQAVLEIQGSVAKQVTVAFGSANGELILDHSAQFQGLIAGSSSDAALAPTDMIDLKDLAFTSSMSTTINYDINSNTSTVGFSNGSNTITLQFSGKDPLWNLSSDGHGGTVISDPAATNPIAIENALPGTPQSVWQISPGQDSTKLQGFTTAISTNIGGTVQFKVDNLTGNPDYQIQIYRLGYYGGDGARLITTLQHTTSVTQPAPITNPATGEVDAGNWSVTDSWNIPSSAVSGVYIANVVQGSQVFQIPFIVKNPSSTSDIVFQTDDETWQAYNGWGGANLYGGNGPSAGGPQGGAGAAYAVSYNRPITTYDSSGAESGVQDTVWGSEYSAIYWLEQNGYDVSYISGMDTATNGSLLLNHKVFMDVGHDEYWTDSQVANVQAAANAGVNLAFMSGNEIFWQTQFTPSIDGSNTANRTLVTYKDSHFEQLINPSGQGTGSFEAPTNWGGAGMPSNALTGTVFQVDQVPTLGSITIPYGETQLRVWRNTSVANTAPGQTATLSSDLLGYEWDSAPDNGFEPVGLVDLSSTTVTTSGSYNTEFGNIDTSGTATHNLVEYRDPTSGALVFGAGTVFWSWGLSDQIFGTSWGGSTPDPNVEQATVNLFADMGVQPATLQASLAIATASTDHTPPTSKILGVSTTSPVEGQSVTVTGTATDAGGGVIAGVDVSIDGGKTWHPANGPVGAATENWSYTFTAPAPGKYTIESRAVDDSINVETASPGVSYNVSASTALSIFSSSATPATADVADPNGVELGVKFTSSTTGQITGIRFYKGPLNTGTHVVDLWSSTGTLLATATSTNETASGWQQVNFSSPVQIAAGTTYVASYHTTNGRYSDTPYYFDTLQSPTNGSLSAIASGLDGLFAYSSGSIFPNNVPATGDNYWVDVVFNDTSTEPQATNVSGFATTENTALSISASALLAQDTDPGGLPLSFSGVSNPTNGTVTYNASTQTITFTPNSGYTGPASFTYTITDGKSTGSGNVSLTVNDPVTAQTLFYTADTPATVTVNDASSVELGVKFQPSTNGTITAIRFYKGPQNTGTHVADLWSSTGTLLATATFTNETASGWQQVNLSNPVVVTAGTTYVVSYHTSGDYSATSNYFASAHTNGALTAPASGTSGGNGLFAYGTGSIFPTNSFNASNYFVDVVFDGAPLQPPVANNVSLSVVENTALSIPASAILANDTDPYGLPLSITGVSNPSNGAVTYNASTQSITFTPNSGYLGPANFTYTIADSVGDTAAGNVAVSVTLPPPIANNVAGLAAAENTVLSIPASVLLANDTDPNGLPLSIASVGNASNGSVTYDPNTQTVSFTPNSNYLGPAAFTYTITDGQVSASANVALTVNYPVTAQSLFKPSDQPAVEANDSNSVELGVEFQASANGTITGIRFYKGALDAGTHVADLWSSNGTLLATGTFTNETATGWQQVNFSQPVAITAGTTYVASYHTSGNYSDTAGYFTAAHTYGELTALANGGVFAYGTGSVFPTNSFNANNYWVDVVFNGSPSQPPVANNVSGLIDTTNTTLSIPASTLLANDTDPGGRSLSISGVSNPSNGTVSYNASTQTVSFVPTGNYVGPASFAYTITDGNASASANVALTVGDASLFGQAYTPSTVTVNDPNSIELGVKFQSSENGTITGIEFYKGPQNAGPHVADLWSATGTLLATATFTNETASGWQEVNFSNPVAVTAGTTYIASYHTNGDYSATPSFFAAALTNGPLTAPASSTSGGNGVFAYGSTSLFPTNSFNSTNYGVDVLFRPQLAA